MRKTLASLAAAALVAGCAATPGGGALNTNTPEDAGTPPHHYQEAVQAYLGSVLKDPYSLRDLNIGRPALASCAVGIYGAYWGWRVPVSYNAKNSYGAYVGTRMHYFWFHGDALKGVNEDAALCTDAPAWR